MDDVDESIRVLIVDDHRMFAEGLARLLADEIGIVVVGIGGTGREAIELVGELRPQVLLLGHELPDGDGVAVLADVKQLRPETLIVMLSGSGDARVLLAAINAGCSGFLTKDRAAAEVGRAVRGAAAGEATISPVLLGRLLPMLSSAYRSLGSDLTDRERSTLGYLADGWSNKAIACELNLSANTVRNNVQSLLTKLGAHTKLEAVSTAVREGLVIGSSTR
jgi:two-component system response regulator DevR